MSSLPFARSVLLLVAALSPLGLGCADHEILSPVPLEGEGAPLTAPREQWTWVPVEGAFCADGNPTGLAVNLTDRSPNAVIFLAGGGACWDYHTCYESQGATFVANGFVESDLPFLSVMTTATGVLNRDDPENPFRDASVVSMPYCTGDAFTGDHRAVHDGKTTHHVGHANVMAYLKRIVPTFPRATRITLVGVSAGGIGAAYNWWHAQQAFGDIRVDMIDDSGAALPSPYLTDALVEKWRGAWDLDKGLPPGCTECTTHLDALIGWSAVENARSRGALLSYTEDTALPFFLDISRADYGKGLDALAAQRLDGLPNVHYYYFEGKGHVLMPFPKLAQNGVFVWDWIRAMVEDDPSWASVRP